MKKFARHLPRLMRIVILTVCMGIVAATTARAEVPLPRSLSITADPLSVEDVRYQFDVTLSDYRVEEGQPQLRVTVSIVKQGTTQVIRIKDIVQWVFADASSVSITADGRRFTLEASYPERAEADSEPRWITTTFGKMFAGGRIGILVRLTE
jgi:hypothetical protein